MSGKGNGLLLPLALGAGALWFLTQKANAANKTDAPGSDGAPDGSADAEADGGASSAGADGSAQPAAPAGNTPAGSGDGDEGDDGSSDAPVAPPSVSTRMQQASQGGGMFSNMMQMLQQGASAQPTPQASQDGGMFSNAMQVLQQSPNGGNTTLPNTPASQPAFQQAGGGVFNSAMAAVRLATGKQQRFAQQPTIVVKDKLTPAEQRFVSKKSFTDADVIRRPDLVRYAMTKGKSGMALMKANTDYLVRVQHANRRHKTTKKVAIVPNKNIVAAKPGTGMLSVAMLAAKRAAQLSVVKGKPAPPARTAVKKAPVKKAPRRKPVRRKQR